jgi:hypothetical protein
MGTSIGVFFPRTIKSTDEIASRLDSAFARGSTDLSIIAREGWPGTRTHTRPWHLVFVPPYEGEPAYNYCEDGPYGFGIYVYRNVAVLGNINRFASLYDPKSPIARPLQAVIETVVETLADRLEFAAVAEGMGDSDAATDCAYLEDGSFSAVSDRLRQSNGEPARTWGELATGKMRWCLRTAEPWDSKRGTRNGTRNGDAAS